MKYGFDLCRFQPGIFFEEQGTNPSQLRCSGGCPAEHAPAIVGLSSVTWTLIVGLRDQGSEPSTQMQTYCRGMNWCPSSNAPVMQLASTMSANEGLPLYQRMGYRSVVKSPFYAWEFPIISYDGEGL